MDQNNIIESEEEKELKALTKTDNENDDVNLRNKFETNKVTPKKFREDQENYKLQEKGEANEELSTGGIHKREANKEKKELNALGKNENKSIKYRHSLATITFTPKTISEDSDDEDEDSLENEDIREDLFKKAINSQKGGLIDISHVLFLDFLIK